MNIRSLMKEAFYRDDASRATMAIEQARAAVSAAGRVDAISLEVMVPENPDEDWLRERVLRPLIYFCQSIGATPPGCPGVFMTFFEDNRMSCVLGAEVIAWAAAALGVAEEKLVDEYGTREDEHAAPRTPA